MRALLCLVLPHVRLGRLVHEEGGVLHSRCRRCGAPLIKKDDHVWVRDPAPARKRPHAGQEREQAHRLEEVDPR